MDFYVNCKRYHKGEAMNTRQILGLIGSIVLFIGVFTPIASAPIFGNIDYFLHGTGDGVVILILAAISLVLVLKKKYKGLWFTGVGCLTVMAFTFIHFQMYKSDIINQLESKLAGNPFRGLIGMAIRSIHLQWGCALLIVGAGLVIASAAMKEENKINR